jgi:hypothetical protein
VLVGILQRSLARRHPHGDTGHFLESRRMSTLINTSRHNSKWFNVTQNDSKQSKLLKKIVEEPHWNDSKWLEMIQFVTQFTSSMRFITRLASAMDSLPPDWMAPGAQTFLKCSWDVPRHKNSNP